MYYISFVNKYGPKNNTLFIIEHIMQPLHIYAYCIMIYRIGTYYITDKIDDVL